MSAVKPCKVPERSLLSLYGGPKDYRDCYYKDVPGEVSLSVFVESFYTSKAFLPERLLLGLITRRASNEHARAVARGISDRFAAWRVVERDDDEILLESADTNTASWFGAEPIEDGTRPSSGSAAVGHTRLYFGSWVGNLDESRWKKFQGAHVWYSKALLAGV
ncbi:MAG: hypothetical protein QNI87_06690 [Erythrobacter sp.]|uniref:hypothetical protein n=1 Tax=Erythrobacter sp. TaxID=1042 RepID=UPI0026381DAD|nr:hypothetical protein [Erythrobacter sp.]MDJ0978204.1 hypothetical protein [Erythrobacter sp.]